MGLFKALTKTLNSINKSLTEFNERPETQATIAEGRKSINLLDQLDKEHRSSSKLNTSSRKI